MHLVGGSDDMASLSVGSNNFPNRVYENPPQLVERTVALCEKYERPVATWQQAREILGLASG
ncbi:3-keto-5-aminohexanoate cleavage protein [Halomonas sp. BC04]|uniref:3-keto-5-aminohexanoate cleavage protein n=1 Tax=Halomonas sp. BC04 TaxID=1403540 RepID=UPI0003ED5BDD|nr:3-keto-5-aminohexanoate cleavage protein [Halomonas sp. BC04]EWG99590.1 hypothetical protein Q427_24060 [Halomonas sp. BC04]